MATFQERFNSLYEKSNLSQKEFGSIFGASTDQVYNWRNGRGEPDSEMMKKIAESCNVSVDWLVGKTTVCTSLMIRANQQTDTFLDDLPPEAEERVREFIELMRLKYSLKYSKKNK